MVKNGYVECPDCHVQHEGTSAAQFPVDHGVSALMKKLKEFGLYPATKKLKTLEGPASSVSRKTRVSNREEVSGNSKAGKKALKKRIAALKREQREQRQMEAHLCQYQAQLDEWQEQHMENVGKLYEMMEENQSVLFILEQVNSRIAAERAEGNRGKQKLIEVLKRIENVTTASEAIEVIGQAQLCTQEAENWAKQFQEKFPDINSINTYIMVGNHSSIFSQ